MSEERDVIRGKLKQIVFRNDDNDNIHAVVYKRAAGGYGLIEGEE